MINELKMDQRYIIIKLKLTSANFSNGYNSKEITCTTDINSLSCEVKVKKDMGYLMASADVIIYGQKLDDINTQSLVQAKYGTNIPNNSIEIYAGYNLEQGSPSLIYKGDIYSAFPDFNDESRSRKMIIKSQYGIVYQSATNDSHISIKGNYPLKKLFEDIVKKFGSEYKFIGRGLDDKYVVNPRIDNTKPQDKMHQACEEYGYHWLNNDGTIIVAPKSQPFYPFDNVYISADNGMIGYPTGIDFGYAVQTRFRPDLAYGQVVKLVTMNSTLNEDGKLFINKIYHDLANHSENFLTNFELNSYPFGGY